MQLSPWEASKQALGGEGGSREYINFVTTSRNV